MKMNDRCDEALREIFHMSYVWAHRYHIAQGSMAQFVIDSINLHSQTSTQSFFLKPAVLNWMFLFQKILIEFHQIHYKKKSHRMFLLKWTNVFFKQISSIKKSLQYKLE